VIGGNDANMSESQTFEHHGFIWGGKWWHFDTMHFEYRPEIIAYAKSVAPLAAETKSPHQ